MSQIDKRVLVVDNGIFLPVALRLARDFSEVQYFRPWRGLAPRMRDLQIGIGYDEDEHPVRRVTDLWDAIPEADLIVFPDVGDGDLQTYLRSQGHRVWGCGRGEALELRRWETHRLLKSLGLPVVPTRRVTGLDELAAILREEDDLYIKVSTLRGDMETWHHDSWALSEAVLLKLAEKWGPLVSGQMEFLVERPVGDGRAVEVGFDAWCIDGLFPPWCSWGYEIKDAAYIGRVSPYSALPEPLRRLNEALASWLRERGYRGFFSTEARIDGDGTPYLIDPCCRAGSPPSELYVEFWDNLGEILWEGAAGHIVAPSPIASCGAELMLYSEFCDQRWMPIYVPPHLRRWVKLKMSTRDPERDCEYVVPQHLNWYSVGAVVGVGNTLTQAIAQVREHAHDSDFKGLDLEFHDEALDEAASTVAKGRALGLDFGAPPPEKEGGSQ